MNLEEILGWRPVFDGLLCVGSDAEVLIKSAVAVADMKTVAPVSFIPFEMPAEDIERARMARAGYVMLQASPGKTGIRGELNKALDKNIAALRGAGHSHSHPAGLRHILSRAGGGSYLGRCRWRSYRLCLSAAGTEQGAAAIRAFLTQVRRAMDGCG